MLYSFLPMLFSSRFRWLIYYVFSGPGVPFSGINLGKKEANFYRDLVVKTRLNSHQFAAPFKEYGVAPNVVLFPNSLAPADLAEPR